MPEVDRRVVMSPAEFDAIPIHEESPIRWLYDALIEDNDRIDHRRFGDAQYLGALTAGQRLLIHLGLFDTQVKNGGIGQFFWNLPGWIFEVDDGLARVGPPELHAHYGRALESLLDKESRWLKLRDRCERALGMAPSKERRRASLRERWAGGGQARAWNAFRQSLDLLDLGWFDDLYLAYSDHNESGEWVCMSRGLSHAMGSRLADHVRGHPDEFIAPGGSSSAGT